MAKRLSEEAKVEMTPMIDVVFQLLIFFVVTLKQDDILAKLTAARPGAEKNPVEDIQLDLIDITVHRNGFIFKGKPVSRDTLDRQIERYSKFSKNASIILRCTNDSKQSYLVQAMDICAKHNMKNLSIFSM